MNRRNTSTHEKLSRAGRKGAAARWGHSRSSSGGRQGHGSSRGHNGSSSQSNRGHSQSQSSHGYRSHSSYDGRRSGSGSYGDDREGMSHEEAGRLGAEARWGGNYSNSSHSSNGRRSHRSSSQHSSYDGRRSDSGSYGDDRERMSHEEAGRLGAEARWGGDYSHSSDDSDYDGRRSNRGSSHSSNYDRRRSGSGSYGNNRERMSHEEAGRRGAEARWGGDYSHSSDDSDYDGRRSNRSSSHSSNYDGRRSDGGSYSDDREGMSREEAGRRGVEARWGRDYCNEDEDRGDDSYDSGSGYD